MVASRRGADQGRKLRVAIAAISVECLDIPPLFLAEEVSSPGSRSDQIDLSASPHTIILLFMPEAQILEDTQVGPRPSGSDVVATRYFELVTGSPTDVRIP